MPLSDRDYMRGSHPPNCTCVECTNRRLRKWQASANSRKTVKSPKPPTTTRQRKPSRSPSGCMLTLLVIFILLLFGLAVWSLWGNQITSFISTPSPSPPPSVTEPSPQSPFEITEPAPNPAPVQPAPEQIKSTPTPTSPSTSTKPAQVVQTKVSYTSEEVEELIYLLINNERQSFGLNPLRKDSLLTSLSREHSISMVKHGFFSHNRATDERDFGYGQPPGTTRGENIAEIPQRRWIPGPYLTLNEVCEWTVSGWMESIGHRENILEQKFTKTGVGVSSQEEYLYITQMFEGAY